MTQLLSRENEHELCLFGRLSSKIIRGPSRSDSYVRWMYKDCFFPIFSSQNTAFYVLITLFTKCEHTIKQAVAFSFPVSTHYAWNAWVHDPLLATKKLEFYDSGFPTSNSVSIGVGDVWQRLTNQASFFMTCVYIQISKRYRWEGLC